MNLDRFVERAAIMEFDGGMSRFVAETAAAESQGVKRWEVLNEIRGRNLGQAPDIGATANGNGADDVPGVQRGAERQNRPLPERHIQV